MLVGSRETRTAGGTVALDEVEVWEVAGALWVTVRVVVPTDVCVEIEVVVVVVTLDAGLATR